MSGSGARSLEVSAEAKTTVSELKAALEKIRDSLLQVKLIKLFRVQQEAQLMLTTGSTRLAVSRGQQTWYHFTCYI